MKRRKGKNKGQYFVLILLFFFSFFTLMVSVTVRYFLSLNRNEGEIRENTDRVEEERIEKLSLVMVGDNLIHDKIYRYAKTEDGYDFRPILSKIKPIVSAYDVAYYNQETILGGSALGVSSYPSFNSPQEVGDAMVDAGFNLVSLATNHTLDRGIKAVLASRTYWDSQDGVLAVGSYASWADRDKVVVKEKNGITYTLLNYTYGTNGIRIPEGSEYLVNVWPVLGSDPSTDSQYQAYKEQVKKDVDAVRGQVDLLMVAMHWGVEYQYVPSLYQKDMAEYLASLGVDIVIGTHPHVVEPITWINQTLVIYSLGNFLSAHEVVDMGNRVGLMSMVEVWKQGGKIELKNLKNELLYTYYTANYQDFLVIPFSRMEDRYLQDYQEVYNKYRDIVQGGNTDIVVVE